MSEPEPSPLPPIAAAPLSVVLLPGDAESMAGVVDEWIAVLDGLHREYELLVCDENLAQRHDRVRLLRPSGPGVGAALRAGVAAARHPLLVYAPCDRRYPATALQEFLDAIDRVHVVAGCRTGSPVPLSLRWLGFLYRWTLRIVFGVELQPLPSWLGGRQRWTQLLFLLLFGLRLHDPACPFRLFRREVLSRLPLQSDGPFVHVEVLAKLNFLGCLMDEKPLAWPAPSVPERLRPMLPDLRRVLKQPTFAPLPGPAKAG